MYVGVQCHCISLVLCFPLYVTQQKICLSEASSVSIKVWVLNFSHYTSYYLECFIQIVVQSRTLVRENCRIVASHCVSHTVRQNCTEYNGSVVW